MAFFVMPFHIGEYQLRVWVSNPDLASALVRLLKMFDAIWIVLAAATTYFSTVSLEGLATARRWAMRVLLGSAVLAWVGAATDFPFGHFLYTDRLGIRIGHVLPFAVPLLWLVIIFCSRYLVLTLFPLLQGWKLALGTALVTLLTDLNLERIAWQVRFYWIWYPRQYSGPYWPPVQNFVSWFVAAFLFALAMRSNPAAASPVFSALAPHPRIKYLRPALTLVLINAVFLAVHCSR